MKSLLTGLFGGSLRRFGWHVVRGQSLSELHQQLDQARGISQHVDFLLEMPIEHMPLIRRHFRQAKAQYLQDLFVLSQTGFKRDGFFVEFGSTNGVDISNTYLLETEFSWRGILCEPAKVWHPALRANRRAKIDFDCVWSRSGETIQFSEEADPERSGGSAAPGGGEPGSPGQSRQYPVKTVSLCDLLVRHDAPRRIDFLSMDTEGSEYEILRAFDFDRFTIDIISVEHNHTDNRQRIHDLLTARGYHRVYESLSAVDDWYVLPGAHSVPSETRSEGAHGA